MASDNNPFLVQATYSFKGTNNDELCFKKGDIITITQLEEGGWWEGTLQGKTGWFPSNYVKEYKPNDCGGAGLSVPPKLPPEMVAQQKVYRNLVLKDLVDSERAHVTELQNMMKNFIQPLGKSEILTDAEFRQLVGNIDEIVELHRKLLACLEECHGKPTLEQRMGKIFLTTAAHLKQVYGTYCSNHPKAVCIIEKYRNELGSFMESHGAHSPGIMALTTSLSKPFRRLEKYAGMLQELERHMAEDHPDRGDTQRSVHVYKDIASACSAIRRQKEMELEVLTGTVRGWEGEEISRLGDILHMGSVAVGPDHTDRHLVLFPSTLLLLSVSPRMSAFIYEGKLPLSGINVNRLEDSDNYKNAFEIVGPMIDRILAVCQTAEDQQNWVDLFRQQIRASRAASVTPAKPVAAAGYSEEKRGRRSPSYHPSKVWSASCLRPAPPLRPCLALGREDGQRKGSRVGRKRYEHSYEDDAQILQVIEAYCTSAKTRHIVNSAMLDSPQVLIAEEEKIIIEKTSGNETIIEEKSLVDTVYALKDEVKELKNQIGVLNQRLEEERRARLVLQNAVRTHLLPNMDSLRWEE